MYIVWRQCEQALSLFSGPSYRRRIILSGTIQFCRIADARMRGNPLMNMKIFEQLCGPDALKNAILTTTFWDEVSTHVGLEHEAQLRSEFGAGMIAQGCRVARLKPRKRETAWEIIDTVCLIPQPLSKTS